VTTIWNATGVTPDATYRVPVDVSSSGAASRVTVQQLADLATLVGTTHNALGSISGAVDFDLSLGPYVSATVGGALTPSFTNPPASPNGCEWTLVLTNGGSAIVTWPGSVTWAGATAPTLTASGTDVLHFVTGNGGTNWYGWHERDEAASGDVVGPASSTDNAVARFDSTTGKLLQNTSNVTIADTGAVSITPDANAKALTIASHTHTTSNPAIDVSQTWNAAGVTFTGWKFNVTDTASAAGSILADWQIGGSSRARLLKAGEVSVSSTDQSTTYAKLVSGYVGAYLQVKLANTNISRIYSDTSGVWMFDDGSSGAGLLIDAGNGIRVGSGSYIGFGDATNTYIATADVRLFRDAANRLALRRTTNAQTLIVSGTYTDASNYVQAELAATSTAVTLTATTAGTGADNVPLTISAAGTESVIAGSPFKLKSYTAATLPSASAAGAGAMIYVTDESDGAIPAFSDGTNWRRVTDRAVVS